VRRLLPLAALLLSAPPALAQTPQRPVMPPEEVFTDLVERPLFNPDRRGRPEAPPEPAGTVATGSFVIVGLAGTGQGRAVAVLRQEETGQQLRVLTGDQVNGWRVERIARGRLEISAGGETRSLAVAERLPAPP